MIRYINLVFFAGMIVMNYLANALPLNGKTTGQLSDAYQNLFVPAGITFSIWGIIYMLIAAFSIFQFTGKGRIISDNIGWLFALSCFFNGLWIVAWHYEKLPLSLLIMAGLLVTLILLNLALKGQPWGLAKATFGIYLGWICIATIANVTALLVSYNWNGFGISQEMWAIIMILAGTLIATLTIFRMNNPFIGLAVIWAFAGIIIKRTEDYRMIAMFALIGIVFVASITVFIFVKPLLKIS